MKGWLRQGVCLCVCVIFLCGLGFELNLCFVSLRQSQFLHL